MDYEDYLVELFIGFTDEELEDIMAIGKKITYKAGETIFYEGEAGTAIYVIQNGSADILKTNKINNKPILLNTLGSGSFFGEMSTIDVNPRAATVAAKTDLECLVFELDILKEFFQKRKEIFSIFMMNVARIISKRLRKLENQLATYSSLETFALDNAIEQNYGDSEKLIEKVLHSDISTQVRIWQKLTKKLSNFSS